jgi:crotonobetainyl-CoA:carnitine CoA-transferase CaiB-like acyl-CoA transferase
MPMAGALEGLRVIEAAGGVAGPYAGKLLAGLGADVVKLEPPEGDPNRHAGPFPGDQPHVERSGLHLHLNSGKRSVVAERAGLSWEAAFRQLVAGADVVLIDRQPPEGPPLAAGLRNEFPHSIIVSVTPFGLDGPYATHRATEIVAYALSGYMMLTGSPGREPLKAWGDLVQYEAGAQAALGALAAVFARERTGQGQVVDVSWMEAGTFLLGGVEQNAYFFGEVPRRNGTRLVGFAAHHPYPSTIRPCKDGYVHAHSNNRHLDLLGAMIPHPRLHDPEVLHTMTGHADEIDAIMDEWLASRTRAEVVREAQSMRLPFTEVMTPGEVVNDPAHRERGSLVTVSHPGAGEVLQPGAPIQLSATPWETGPAPLLGEHTEVELGRPAPPPRPVSRTASREAKPLAGLRILDFTNAVAGPIATFILADLGAEVIKVEGPGSRPKNPRSGIAPLREGAGEPGYNRLLLFNELNRGKRSVSIDVAKPGGRELFLALVAECDAVVQNFAPRVMHNLGVGYEQLRAAKDDIILVSMPAFGLSGAYRDRISYGPGIDAMSGLSHLTGYADGPPMKPGNFFCDQHAGVHAAFATLAALRHRERTGEGQHVELAMFDGELQVVGDALLDYVMNGREQMRMGNDHPSMAPHAVFPCASDDSWLAVAVEDDDQWHALCKVIGRPDLTSDPRFANRRERHANRADLYEPIAAWTRQRDHYEAQEALQAAGVAAGAALDAAELLRDPHVLARRTIAYVETPGVGPTPCPRVAFTLSETPAPPERPAPAFAEANGYVLRELLRLPEDEVERLLAAGVISATPF